MPIRLRFSLHGHRHNRIFHLVAVDQSARRDAKPTELLGIYHRYPTTEAPQKTIEWSVERIRYWLSVGAIPTRAVSKLLEAGNILKPNSSYHSIATNAARSTPKSEHGISQTDKRVEVPAPSASS
ncbi:hypothetical protein H0H87_009163 [Tephrocybe sp. NHM501043]|nr:hypothetical protein H0H87_009163 [Tephrocybe sp. NHM501043]